MMKVIVDRVWRPQDAEWFALAYKDEEDLFHQEMFNRNEFKEAIAWVEEHKAEWDLYFCPHGFTKPHRLKKYAVKQKWLWADLDGADPREIKYRPTIAIESSKDRYVGLWLADTQIDENLNKRLTYAIGADKGGWDLTQVLRIPGTWNFKRSKPEKVRLMWANGPSYIAADLKDELPLVKDKSTGGIKEGELTVQEAYDALKSKMPLELRKNLATTHAPEPGKRSDVLYKIGCGLVEIGATKDQVYVLIKNSVFNKWSGKSSEESQLEREINKYFSEAGSNDQRQGIVDEDLDRDNPRISVRNMHEIKEENADWLWFPFLARGEITILEGDPDLGKSYLMHAVSQKICSGGALPVEDAEYKRRIPPSKVFYCDLENSPGITKRRLIDNRMSEEGMKNFFVTDSMMSITNEADMELLTKEVMKVKPLVIVFDTVNTYIGKADMFKGHEAQQAFNQFKVLAQKANAAVVVLRHVTKSNSKSGVKALYRGQGSISQTGVARIVISMGRIPDDENGTRGFLTTKCNIGPKSSIMTFNIESIPNEQGQPKGRSRFVWGQEWTNEYTAEQLMDAAAPKKNTDPLDAIKVFLTKQLTDGAWSEKRLVNMIKGRNYDESRLDEALKQIGATSKKNPKDPKDLIWSLKAKP